MKLYTTHNNPTGRKILAVLAYLGLEAETVTLDFAKGDHQSPEYLSVNPNGLVPALVDGDKKIWESNAIMIYLAKEKAPDNTLFAPEQQTEILQWLFWEAAQYNAALRQIAMETLIRPNLGLGGARKEIIANAQDNFLRYGAVLNDHLENRNFIVGNDWTLADYAVGFGEQMIEKLPIDLDQFPHVKAFYERMRQNPHWAGTWRE